jgi:hypothetical protein
MILTNSQRHYVFHLFKFLNLRLGFNHFPIIPECDQVQIMFLFDVCTLCQMLLMELFKHLQIKSSTNFKKIPLYLVSNTPHIAIPEKKIFL